MKHSTLLITDCESDSSFTTTNTIVNANSGATPALQPMQRKAVSMLYPKNIDDQATIVSTSRSCNTPPPNSMGPYLNMDMSMGMDSVREEDSPTGPRVLVVNAVHIKNKK